MIRFRLITLTSILGPLLHGTTPRGWLGVWDPGRGLLLGGGGGGGAGGGGVGGGGGGQREVSLRAAHVGQRRDAGVVQLVPARVVLAGVVH